MKWSIKQNQFFKKEWPSRKTFHIVDYDNEMIMILRTVMETKKVIVEYRHK